MPLPVMPDAVTVVAALPPPGARFQKEKQRQRERPISELAEYIRECWQANHDHKVDTGVQESMLQCTRQRNGEYDADDAAKLGAIDVFLNVTGLKCRAAESWIKDVLVNAADQPWTIQPTPLPELSADLNLQVADLVRREVEARGYVDRIQIDRRVKELKQTALREQQRIASDACDRMTQKINDQMAQGGWKAVFEQWQSDIVTYPGGVLKGPVVRHQQNLKWDGNTLVPTNEAILVCERVSPLDLYPSPEATTPQDANSLIEVMRLTKAQLYDCIGLPHFDEPAIRLVISEYEDGYRDWLNDDSERANSEKTDTWGAGETLDVIDFWGRVQGSTLAEWGIQTDDPEAQVECNAWLIGDTVIRALLNPDPLGRRPYRVTSFNKLPGQFWGEGICQLIRDIQRSANSAARALLRNMAYASGPVVEIDVDRLDEAEDTPEDLTPWRVFYTRPSTAPGGGGPAIRYVVAPSLASQLMRVFDRFMALADDFSGVPAYTYGNASDTGSGGGSTMGGLSLLYGNALKGIKNVIMNMDRDGIEPTITAYWTFNMLYDPDDSLKADAQVMAKGAEGILQKEQAQARSIETLQVIRPFVESGDIPRQGAQHILREWLRQQGFDVGQFFPDPAVEQEIVGAFGVGGQQLQPSTEPGTPTPRLDGRQAPVQQVQRESRI